MNYIFAIDPGTLDSAWLVYALRNGNLVEFGIEDNLSLRDRLKFFTSKPETILAIEQIRSYGMPVGKSVFDTVQWTGRFIECWSNQFIQIPRIDVKMHLCKNTRAKDGNVRQAIIDRYPATGGGKTPQIGTKAKPGPLYGVSKDVWAALAVAITTAETLEPKYL